ncbi:MAG: cell division protein FtsK [Microbacterium sp.]|nr:MAG: cell division protein FtsK [Microbacterium sp.]
MHDHADEPLRLPAAPAVPARPALPIAAAIVPVIGAVVLWRVTGSAYALWFAALGPLMAGAGLVDGWRTARGAKRRARREAAAEIKALDADVTRRHDDERRRAWRRTPDVAGYAEDPDEVWRVVPGREGALVVGRGSAASGIRVDGEAHDESARAVRRRARTIDDMPACVPLEGGVAVVGPAPLAAGVVRALAVQACLAHPPGRLRLVGVGAPRPGDPASGLDSLPHALGTSGTALFVGMGGRGAPPGTDAQIVGVREGEPPPPGCAAVLTLAGGESARLDHDGMSRDVRVEAISRAQAEFVAGILAERASQLGYGGDRAASLDELSAPDAVAGSLAAVVGVRGGDPVVLDLVADGPHAIVVGVTGAGKSELLTTWIVGLCRGRSPQELALLLVDFKGGRTFDALASLPHVTGVLTDLDEGSALRAVESLRAEVRHRERVLAECGARDVAEAAGALGGLVIVVDEYAALVAAHPQLHDLFGDLAARGRALGMHLILASQRVGGAFRDGVLANAPLRIAFRVTDAADSRAVLGVDDAARLPGAESARGTALVRRAIDDAPLAVRVARCDAGSLEALRAASAGAIPARKPWLAPLPAVLGLAQVRGVGGAGTDGGIVLGLADEPEHQRQSVVLLAPDAPGLAVIGGPGSGRTTLLRTIAVQSPRVLWTPDDPESAWDAVMAIDDAAPGTTVIVDDADAIAARLGGEYGALWVAALERAAREARGRSLTLVLSLARVSGGLGRVVDLLPQRALLALPTRADHAAAGGDPTDFVPDAPPGRGRWGRRLVQFAVGSGESVAVGVTGGPAAARAPGTVGALASVSARASGGDTASAGALASVGATTHTASAPPLALDGARPIAFVVPPGPAAAARAAACADAGRHALSVDEAAADPSALGAGDAIIGTPETWLAQWRVLAAARERCDLVVDAACVAEYRAVSGRRDLPPFVAPGAPRAWLLVPGATRVRRVSTRAT